MTASESLALCGAREQSIHPKLRSAQEMDKSHEVDRRLAAHYWFRRRWDALQPLPRPSGLNPKTTRTNRLARFNPLGHPNRV